MKNKTAGIIISVLITLLFVRTALKLFDFSILKSAGSLNVKILAAGAVCYVFTYPLRAFRIHHIAKTKKGFTATLLVCFRHQFLGRILPFRTGDLSLVYLLSKYCGNDTACGGSTLLAIRFFDGIVMLSSFALCTALSVKHGSVNIILAVGAVLLLLAAAPFAASKAVGFAKKRFPDNKLTKFAEKVRLSLSALSVHDFLILLATTILLWLFIYLSMHFTARSFGIDISFINTVSASFLASAAALLPINGIGGFGVTETGWTAGFIMMGAERNAALTSGVVSNIMSFCIVCVFGAISLFLGDEKNV